MKVKIIILILLILSIFDGCFNQQNQNEEPYISTYKSMYVRGTFNSWWYSPMKLTENNLWTITNIKTGTTENERFKFDVYANWGTNFGDNNKDGIAELCSADIRLVANTRYNQTTSV